MKKILVGTAVVAVLAAGGLYGANHYATAKLEAQLDKSRPDLQAQGMDFQYQGASVNLLTHSWQLKGLTVTSHEQGELVHIQSVSSDNFDFDKLPADSTMELKGLTLGQAMLDAAPAELQDKLARLKVDAHSESHFDKAKGTLVADSLIQAPEFGEFQMSFDTAGATPFLEWVQQYSKENREHPKTMDAATEQALMQEVMPKFQQLQIQGLTLRFKDQGLLDSLYGLKAKLTGMDKAKQQAQLLQAVNGNPLLSDAHRQALADFIHGGHQLLVKAAPTEKLSFGDMMTPAFQNRVRDPKALLAYLGVTLNGQGFN
ncbi:hypothetical protein PVT67_03670 [Gallaecimonas kandeliae]|uniref:hypothetical protein n=1 Tax=Gallaecimonas kandeliae TaxID=3029055 RepID=UPI00264A178C|nr:hypothetical protein [Gallaecimonas kandeliae]WKE66359.1 hypothetical protein PVT67_03670 [Gallaecimonas kandeliae]